MNIRQAMWLARGLALLATVMFVGGCEGDGFPSEPPDPQFDNAVFSEASHFVVVGEPAPSSVVGTTPTFTWQNTRQRFVFVGVFIDNIVVHDGAIVNADDNVWAWHSGLGTAREGAVNWEDGVGVVNGQLQDGTPPGPLEAGRSYVWAVWAWDRDGVHVTHSSGEVYFTVE